MKRLLLPALLLLAGFAAEAASAATIRIVAPWRASQYEGAIVAVRGRAEVRRDTNLMGTEVRLTDADGKISFIGFIPKLNEYSFPDVESLNGREVVMYGVIEMYYATPATQLIFRNQLQPWPPRS